VSDQTKSRRKAKIVRRTKNDRAGAVIELADELRRSTRALEFAPPVAYVYAPLDYAWRAHRAYLERYAGAAGGVLLVGMNPGPFGMAQTGVPFGDVSMARDWLGLDEPVEQPRLVHPKRPIQGFACTRGEVSGRRLWGWARDRFVKPNAFFKRWFVWNYCPLAFMEESGRNRTPDKLPKDERDRLFEICDASLCDLVMTIRPKHVVGIGRFARDRCERALMGLRSKHMGAKGELSLAERRYLDAMQLAMAPHPSPASPAANRGWVEIFEAALLAEGIELE
jgi:single-strand selective monofunctional uracil DNA glycosylase